ncbi:hypothetical protein BSNK01_23800 [Bacillaceae bacterium]
MRGKRRLLSTVLFFFVLYFSVFPSAQADGKYPVRIVQQNLIVYPAEESVLQVIHTITYKNNGTAKEKELPIYLPDGYEKLQLNEGLKLERIKTTERGIVDTNGLEPGEEKRVILSYVMPINNRVREWEIEQPYVTETLNVVIPEKILSFQAPYLLTQSERVEMNGREFRRFTRVDLHPDKPWPVFFRTMQIQPESPDEKGKGQAGANEGDEGYTADGKRILGHQHGAGYGKAATTLLIIILAFTSVLRGLRNERPVEDRHTAWLERPWLFTEKENILQQIAQLEKDYRTQLISEETYVQTKKQLREQLVRIALELRRGTVT